MAATLDEKTAAFLQHLHRGGCVAYYWLASEEKDDADQPLLKRTIWWEINGHVPAPPSDRTRRLRFHLYFGICPVIAIPTERTGKFGPYIPKPESIRPKSSEIAALNCLFAEFDFKHFASPAACIDYVEALTPPASVITHSGGGLHVYWLFAQPFLLDTDARRERGRTALADWVERIGAERESKDLARVLRLPGSINYKEAYGPNFPKVTYLRYDLTRTYLLDDLQPPRTPKAAPVFAWDLSSNDEVEKAQRALDRLGRWRVDEYDAWLKVGLALRDLGSDGLRLWDAWSSRGQSYRSGVCDAKWATFVDERRGITIGSLYAWAKEDDPGGESRRVRPLQREVRTVARAPQADATAPADDSWLTVDQARALIEFEMAAYLANPLPTEILVIAAPAGIGKSHLAVKTAEGMARQGRRTLYCAPRRNFFEDVVQVSRKINGDAFDPLKLWYPWEGRTTERADGSTPCAYPEAMTQWLAKGHGAMGLCSSGLCGWEYVSGPNACPYHKQKDVSQPILFAQHAHAVLGHPLLETCHVVIGDEAPIESFTHEWTIPRRAIVPKRYPHDDPMTDLLRDLTQLSQRIETGDLERPLSGPELLAALGGAAIVAAAVANPPLVLSAPHISRQKDVSEADYNHIPVLAALLQKEAEESLAGRAYIRRVIVTKSGLLLLRGYLAAPQLPPHVIWLDATANEAIYKELFWPRPVRIVAPKARYQGQIYVITDRSWSKWSLVRDGEQGAELVAHGDEPRVAQMQRVVEHIIATREYRAPAIVTYKDLGSTFFGDLAGGRLHFYGNRGSNALEYCDALFVAGVPQPSRLDLLSDAAMLFKRRMRAFDEAWIERADRAYDGVIDENGEPLSYPVSTFADPDLATLHWQKCEAELIQALNRARPLVRQVDVWLLANRPLGGVPVTRLWSLRELFGAPEGVDIWLWLRVAACEPAWTAVGALGSTTIAGALGCSAPTARKLCEGLISTGRWRLADPSERSRTRGHPPLVIVPTRNRIKEKII